MRIITERRLREASSKYPNLESAINRWILVVRKANWTNLAETKATYPHADQIKTRKGRLLTVFNLGERRLITAIHYNRKMVFIRSVLTHAEYDKGRWKEND